MSISLLPLDAGRWHDGKGRTLVLSAFDDERPLRGAAGLADWRMCGRLSRVLLAGRVSGEHKETMLLPAGPRLPFAAILWFGLGGSADYAEARFSDDLRWMSKVLDAAKLSAIALQLPGRATGRIGARRALELLLATWDQRDETARQVAIVEDAAGQKEAGDLLRQYGVARSA